MPIIESVTLVCECGKAQKALRRSRVKPKTPEAPAMRHRPLTGGLFGPEVERMPDYLPLGDDDKPVEATTWVLGEVALCSQECLAKYNADEDRRYADYLTALGVKPEGEPTRRQA